VGNDLYSGVAELLHGGGDCYFVIKCASAGGHWCVGLTLLLMLMLMLMLIGCTVGGIVILYILMHSLLLLR